MNDEVICFSSCPSFWRMEKGKPSDLIEEIAVLGDKVKMMSCFHSLWRPLGRVSFAKGFIEMTSEWGRRQV